MDTGSFLTSPVLKYHEKHSNVVNCHRKHHGSLSHPISEIYHMGLQRDLDKLGQWVEEWQMEFNLDKCEVDRVVKKAFSMFAFIAQTIDYRSWDVMFRLYRTL
eukprot:g37477.t1